MADQLDRRTVLMTGSALAAVSAVPISAEAEIMAAPPVARVAPVTETLFGVPVVDRYRWMEAGGPEWEAYTRAQGSYAGRVLAAIPGRDALAEAVSRDTGALVAVSGVQTGGRYIFTEVRPAGANTFKLYVRDGMAGADRLLIDPDATAAAGSHGALDWWSCSPDGEHVVFGLSAGGSENSTARVVVTATGALLPESIDRTEYGNPSWTPDGAGFFYNRLKAGMTAASLDKYKLSACWFHRLNTDPASDIKALAQGMSPVVAITDIDFPGVQATAGSDILIGAVVSGVQNELALYAASLRAFQAGAAVWRPICSPSDKVTNATVRGDRIYLVSHQGAPHYQVIETLAAEPHVSGGKLVVPESASVIKGISAARDALYIEDLDAGLGGMRRLRPDGRIEAIALPFEGAIGLINADALHDGVWFSLQGWVRPPVLCHAAATGAVVETDLAPKPAIDTAPYDSVEVFATARDRVKVPLSIVYRKGLKRDGSAPLLLNAYGAYGITIDPAFVARWLPFLDAGGVFAVAHVRGGGELGEDWHLAGQKLTKPNTWRDMIDAAQYLIDNRYTRSAKMAIIGGSAGGITVGRFLTERPDLAAVAISQVGVSNAMRSEFSPNGPPNVPEFGTVSEADGFKALAEMDAYQHVKDGVSYPSVMLTTGLNDPRVSSWEPTKMTARLQAANASKNPILLRIDADAGHGVGSTRSQRDKETADIIAFLLWRTGDPRYQPAPM